MKKFILIFGASSGISKFFLRNSKKIKKFNVILTSRSNSNLNSLKKEFGFDKSFYFFKVDASKEKDIFQLKRKISKHKIRIIVNFCGDIGEGGKITNLSLSKWKNSIDNNLTSFFNISKFFIPLLLKEKKPIFINFSGGGGLLPQPTLNAYSASKAAVVRLIENISIEFKKLNIIAIAPGAINTKIFKILSKQKKKLSKNLKKEITQRLKFGGDKISLPTVLIDNLIDNKYINFLSGKVISAKYDNIDKILKNRNMLKESDLTLRRIDKVVKIPKYL